MINIDTFKLLGPRVLVKLDEEPDHFSGNIIVKPETVHETAEIEGTILKVGTGHPITKGPNAGGRVPITEVKPGDKVCFIKFLKDTIENPILQTKFGEGIIILKMHDIIYVRQSDE